MTKLNKFLKIAIISLFAGVLITGPVFATGLCNGKYPNLTDAEPEDGSSYPDGFSSKCGRYKVGDNYKVIYGKSASDCAQAGVYASSPEDCDTQGDLNSLVRTIITTIIFAVGMVAVVMIILGGVSYATSQGDPQKVKKAKDTILYGIIGLVVALLAFAIVNFVLSSIQG